MELARTQLANGNVEASIESARLALKGRPDNPDARLLLARGLIARGQLEQAESEMRVLLVKYPNVSAVHSQLGVLHLAKGDHVAAKRSLERSLVLDERRARGTCRSGQTRIWRQRMPTGARARVEARLAATPSDVRLLLLAASTYAATGDPGRAERTLQHAIEIDPSNLQAHAMLGQLFMSEEKLEQAKTEFEALTKRRPDSNAAIASQIAIAQILETQHRLAEAAEPV